MLNSRPSGHRQLNEMSDWELVSPRGRSSRVSISSHAIIQSLFWPTPARNYHMIYSIQFSMNIITEVSRVAMKVGVELIDWWYKSIVIYTFKVHRKFPAWLQRNVSVLSFPIREPRAESDVNICPIMKKALKFSTVFTLKSLSRRLHLNKHKPQRQFSIYLFFHLLRRFGI